jgi:DNA invertase Pin-like site-specific DNA recombinase
MKIVPYYRIRRKGPQKANKPNKVPPTQRVDVRGYAKENDATIVQSFVEVEDGPMEDRPELRAACAKAKSAKAKLVIADHYRVFHDQVFLTILLETGVDFVCLGDSRVQPELVQMILDFEATSRAEAVTRTKKVLAERKAGGVKLGSARPGHWKGREHLRGFKQGAKASAKVRSDRALAYYGPSILPKVLKMKKDGATNEVIAAKLNEDGHTTTAGKPFSHVAVYRLLERYSEDAA